MKASEATAAVLRDTHGAEPEKGIKKDVTSANVSASTRQLFESLVFDTARGNR